MDNNKRKEPNIFSKICSIVIILLIIVGLIFSIVRCAGLTSHASAIDNSNNPLLKSKLDVTKSVVVTGGGIAGDIRHYTAGKATGDYLINDVTIPFAQHVRIPGNFITSTNYSLNSTNGVGSKTSLTWNYDWSHVNLDKVEGTLNMGAYQDSINGGWITLKNQPVLTAFPTAQTASQGALMSLKFDNKITINDVLYINIDLKLPLTRNDRAERSMYYYVYIYDGTTPRNPTDATNEGTRVLINDNGTATINAVIPSNTVFDQIIIVPVYELKENPTKYATSPYITEITGSIEYFTYGTVTAVRTNTNADYLKGYEDGKIDGFLRAYYQLLSSNETEMDEDVKVIYNYLKNKFESGSGNDGSYQDGYSEGYNAGYDIGYSEGYNQGRNDGVENARDSFNTWLSYYTDYITGNLEITDERYQQLPDWLYSYSWNRLIEYYQGQGLGGEYSQDDILNMFFYELITLVHDYTGSTQEITEALYQIKNSDSYTFNQKITGMLNVAGTKIWLNGVTDGETNKNSNWGKGYSEGYEAAKATYSNGGGGDINAITNGFGKIISTLGDSIMQFLNIEVMGVNLHELLAGVAMIVVIGLIIKFAIGKSA